MNLGTLLVHGEKVIWPEATEITALCFRIRSVKNTFHHSKHGMAGKEW
jgi:hypothetical protein